MGRRIPPISGPLTNPAGAYAPAVLLSMGAASPRPTDHTFGFCTLEANSSAIYFGIMLHQEFVRKIAFFRKKRLGEILNGENGLNLNSTAIKNGKNIAWLNVELDNIFYTINFLEKHDLIEVKTYSNNIIVHLFDGIPAEGAEVGTLVNSLHYYYEKLSKSAYSWEVEMKPGLLSFIESGFKTEEELREKRNFWLTIGVALLASAATAILSALFSNWFQEEQQIFIMLLHMQYLA